ncbi:MAG: hypothetical protein N3D16_07620, partial [Anaerolineales bacterium]|nr:hypothetical protein [Anaerolineales bacterium]
QALAFWEDMRKLPNLRLNAVMGYEGHIAGVNDALPGKPLKNALMRMIKKLSIRDLRRRRGEIVSALKQAGAEIEIVNGGGSGS